MNVAVFVTVRQESQRFCGEEVGKKKEEKKRLSRELFDISFLKTEILGIPCFAPGPYILLIMYSR